MQEPFDEEDENNRLRIENEIKKFKLSVEHGANFLSSSEKKLPPQLEGQWLDHVQQFEDAYTNSKRVLVYNFIGKPTYKSSI